MITRLIAIICLLSATVSMARSTHRHPWHCPLKPSPECISTINDHLPRWDVRDEQSQRQVNHWCSGNQGDNCVKTLMTALPWYNKNNLEDLTKIARSCQLTNNACVKVASKSLSRIDFNSMEDVTEVARACARTDMKCFESKCATRDYNCKRKEGFVKAARECFEPCW